MPRVRLSRLRPVSGVNHVAPTRLADGKASLDPLRSVQSVHAMPCMRDLLGDWFVPDDPLHGGALGS